MSINLNIANSVSPINFEGMDIETMMMAVQTERVNLLEVQLKEQIASIQTNNDKISQLNELLGTLNKAAASMPPDAKASDKVKISAKDMQEMTAAALKAGTALPGEQSWDVKLKDGSIINVDAAGKKDAEMCQQKYWAFQSSDYSGSKAVISITESDKNTMTKGELEGFTQQTKSQIDSLSNSQQMDMLRLQSLSNKRNEAFETMTNFMKKLQDGRNAIVGNMR